MDSNEFLRDLNAELLASSSPGSELEDGQEVVSKSWKERGGDGLGGLENLVAAMFDADRVSPFFSPNRCLLAAVSSFASPVLVPDTGCVMRRQADSV